MIDTTTFWNTILGEVELLVSKASFATWFKDTELEKIENGSIFLIVPNAFVQNWIRDKFYKQLLAIVQKYDPTVETIRYRIVQKDPSKEEKKPQKGPVPTQELPLADFYINREDNLNPRYTFDNFVIGPFNEIAYTAAQAIIKNPGRVYNPLFIYGDTGRGKTHLIQGIGNYLKSPAANKKVYYSTSEKFSTDFIGALQAGKINQFKEKYHKYDVLIMDDIQFLSNKTATQEELFHLFNHLHENNKQIIFSSDKHPSYIPNLENRLKSRFGAGMIIDIPAPDHESRAAIFKAKSAVHNLELAPESIEYLANAVDGNIREIEGALNALIHHSQLKGKTLSLTDIKGIIKGANQAKRAVSVKDVVKAIATFYNIDEESIYAKTRRKEIVRPRQIIMYVLREYFNISYPTIGEKLGGRDHTTVMHSCEKIKTDLETDPELAREIEQIRSLV